MTIIIKGKKNKQTTGIGEDGEKAKTLAHCWQK
jgi:hypothetical protein